MSDLISKSALVDALNERCESECEYSKKQRSVMCAACYFGSAKEVVESAPTIDPEWVPVSERLPEEYEDVLLYFKPGDDCPENPYQIGHIGTHVIEDNNFDQIGIATVWYTDEYYCDFDEVAAWMPLPKPYEAERSEE